jgi:ribose transport system permease protein
MAEPMLIADEVADRHDNRVKPLPQPSRRTAHAFSKIVRAAPKIGTVWFLLLCLALARLVDPRFYEIGNLKNILTQNAPIGLIAVGMTFAIICGLFDLSCGSIAGLVAVAYAKAAISHGLWPALAIALGLGLLLGAVNGVLVTKLSINPFIATLATSSIYLGYAYVLSNSQPISVSTPHFDRIGHGTLLGLPVPVDLLIVAVLVGGFVLSRSVFGHTVYAVGGNQEAARLAGIRIDRTKILSYMLVGLMSAFAAIVLTSTLSVGEADMGTDMALQAITIVVIGGTSLFGGEGAMWRTVVGLLLLGVITNVADSRGWSGNIENILEGVVLAAAVGLDVLSRRLHARRWQRR